MRLAKTCLRIADVGLALVVIFSCFVCSPLTTPVHAQVDDPNPPGEVVKLIFIHHSCGENWLSDDHGGLGRALGENNYFVSDTNYGWGPDSIGDRTDITDWPEWFRGPDSGRYLAALYAESGQNSWYTRTLPDPGGENQVVMFKSCFPNSNLEGNPGDPPSPGGGLTVGNAKHIYNDLLNYFATRPDKLFIAVTAPPVQDPAYAANARAFNTWLVQNWLAENNYPHGNVAVFDFYNVLTHPDNHHRYLGQVEYITNHGNTLYYDSDGDDHPNPTGNQKAVAEFIPLLNVYYHRWRAGAPALPPAQETPPPAPAETEPPASGGEQPTAAVALPVGGDLIDDFEAGAPPGSQGWQSFWDESMQTSITCAPAPGLGLNGSVALHVNFAVQANSWATCALFYDEIRDWRSWEGLSLSVRASQPALIFDVIANGGTLDNLTTYLFTVEATQEMVDGWVRLELPWNILLRADWEENPGTPFDPSQVTGMTLGFNTYPDTPNAGEIWVDEMRLIGAAPPSSVASPPAMPATEGAAAPTAAPPEDQEEGGRRGLCPGSIALGALAAVGAVWTRRRRGLQ